MRLENVGCIERSEMHPTSLRWREFRRLWKRKASSSSKPTKSMGQEFGCVRSGRWRTVDRPSSMRTAAPEKRGRVDLCQYCAGASAASLMDREWNDIHGAYAGGHCRRDSQMPEVRARGICRRAQIESEETCAGVGELLQMQDGHPRSILDNEAKAFLISKAALPGRPK